MRLCGAYNSRVDRSVKTAELRGKVERYCRVFVSLPEYLNLVLLKYQVKQKGSVPWLVEQTASRELGLDDAG